MFEKILRNFQKKLVNLSGTNRALLLLRLSKENDFDLNELDYLLNKPSFQVISDLITGKPKIAITNFLDSRNEKVNVAGKQVQRINRKDKFLFEEAGSKDLHIGWPFVQGKFSDGTTVRCPLLFFPVSLILDKNMWYLVQDEGEPLFFNKSFILAWKHFNKTSLPEDFENFSFDSFSKDAREFRTQLYELLKTSGLEINFNSDLFVDKLQAFQNFKSGEFSDVQEDGRLMLQNEAVLGIFPQASSYLLPDYDLLLSNQKYDQFEDFFNKNINLNSNNFLKEVDILTPLLIDAPQEEAIKMVKSGKSIVVQGPPGTGKSQLISNLVSDFISKGKRVLVVCQKRAALDVVYGRLATLNVGSFIALVHDFKSDRSRLYGQINSQIDLVEEFKAENSNLNTVFLERDFLESCKKIDQITVELQEFKDALFDDKECGFSVKELYLNSNRKVGSIQGIDQHYKHFTRENLIAFLEKLQYLLPYAIKFDLPGYIFENRKSFKSLKISDKTQIESTIKEIDTFNNSFFEIKKVFKIETKDYLKAAKAVSALKNILEASKNQIFYDHFQKYTSEKFSIKKLGLLKKILEEHRIDLGTFGDKAMAKVSDRTTIETAVLITNSALNSYNNFITKILWNLTSKDKSVLGDLLKNNQLKQDKVGIKELLVRLKNLQTFKDYVVQLKSSPDYNFSDIDAFQDIYERIELINKSITLSEEYIDNRNNLPEHLNPKNEILKSFRTKLKLFVESIQKVESAYLLFGTYFTNAQLDSFFEELTLTEHIKTINQDFDSLLEFDKEKENLNFEEIQSLKYILSNYQSNKITIDLLISQFENSIKICWINQIEGKFPILSSVSTSKMEKLEQQLIASVENKRKLSGLIILLKLREQVYKNEEFNRLGNSTTFRDLKHQVSKKKKIWPLRKTIESFSNELFYLMPCWLASPETVSAIFPLEEIFDIVIFDEASQCYAEKGLPAIARAKQFVVTGDSKQLPPSDLYSARFEEENDVPETEMNSLLDLASRYLPQVMLTEHYRSQSLDLVHFSNQHFYKGKLKLLPDFNTYEKSFKGIEFIKVDGFFENRQNVAEAEEIVKLCFKLMETSENKEIGIITFNINQQNLIQDMLEQRLILENKLLPKGLIIKNIENIQGDEKDIIIFSIGYAPDSSGKMNHQFGSLNLVGGENRLNVAITRAKEKVIVVSSIHPQQLNVENALHDGPKLLKKYLEYALNVSEGKFEALNTLNSGFSPNWYLKEKLKIKESYKEDLPFADLSEMETDGSFKQLILTDDDKFFNSLNIKETFCYLPTTLRSKSWNFKRHFSRNYNS
ncbi:MAG: DUF4011 domain-containing protein [Opitutaceae bacterium]|nr:DUF4011 domain-containing protein [Cytophagales bacterium]